MKIRKGIKLVHDKNINITQQIDVSAKVHQLTSLREEISKIPDYFLFPEIGKVQGFMGAGSVMFVAERPSTGNFPSLADRFLYRLLEKHGVPDSHLTDLIKSRGKVHNPYPDNIACHRRIFDRELDIIQPRLIIAFGQKVYDLLQFSLAESGIKIHQVWHYSVARWGVEKQYDIDRQVRKALTS